MHVVHLRSPEGMDAAKTHGERHEPTDDEYIQRKEADYLSDSRQMEHSAVSCANHYERIASKEQTSGDAACNEREEHLEEEPARFMEAASRPQAGRWDYNVALHRPTWYSNDDDTLASKQLQYSKNLAWQYCI